LSRQIIDGTEYDLYLIALPSGVEANFDQIEATLIKVHSEDFIFQPSIKCYNREARISSVSAFASVKQHCGLLTIPQSGMRLQPLCFAYS
jgi:hypothetical protein